jgi:FixJ family two-component response regulator
LSAEAPRVFLVDDDDDVRQALRRRIEAAGYVVEAFPSAREFLARPPHDGPACILLDLRMPGMDGLQVQEALEQARSATPVVFLTGQGDVPSTIKALKGGAVDFLLKPVEASQLLDAIARAVNRHAVARAAEAERETLRARWNRLTPREREVCALVARGMLNKQIAGELGAAEKTVKQHRGRVIGEAGGRLGGGAGATLRPGSPRRPGRAVRSRPR